MRGKGGPGGGGEPGEEGGAPGEEGGNLREGRLDLGEGEGGLCGEEHSLGPGQARVISEHQSYV